MGIYAVIGLGSMGQRHATTLRNLNHSVIEIDPIKFPDALSITDIADRHDIDGCVIASPADEHYPQAMYLLQHGYPCFVEKPLALTHKHALEICRVAAANNLPVACGYQLRLTDGIQSFLGALQRIPLDDIYYIVVRYGWDITQWHTTPPYMPRIGIIREASHDIDLMLWIAEQTSIGTLAHCVINRHYHRHYGAEPCLVDIQAEFSSGVPASVRLDYVRPEYERIIEVATRSALLSWVFDPAENETAYQREIAQFCRAVENCDPLGVAVTGWESARVSEFFDL